MITPSPKQVDKQTGQATAPMSLDEARKVLWPFRPYKNHMMGRLVATKQLSLRDLLYAIENAWDVRVRRAATSFMLERLNEASYEAESPTGYLHVIKGGRSFSQRRQLQYFLLEGTLLGFAFGVCICIAIASLSRTLSTPAETRAEALSRLPILFSSPTGIIGFVIALAIFIVPFLIGLWLLEQILKRTDRRVDNHRKGEEGEERVMATISQVLDGNWFAFRNVLLPGRKGGDLDTVLVSPNGVWVLEIKSYTREHRNIGDQWEYGAGNQWNPSRSNPSRQAQKNAAQLRNFLRADGIDQWITPVVVWANPEFRVEVENPSVAVWTLEHLPEALTNTGQNGRLPDEKRQHIIDKLTKLCERQKAAALKERER